MRVTVKDTGEVILCVPSRATDAAAVEFLRSQGEWIVHQMSRVPRPVSLMEHMRRHPWISAGGRKHGVEIGTASVRSHWAADPDRALVVIRCLERGDPSQNLGNVLVEIARELLPPRVREIAGRVDTTVDRVCVRNQRTLWGSCTCRGSVSLNWRLLLLPPELQDHIIYHELAHLTHLDHSPRFYELLARYDPCASEHDHQVSKLSPQIMALGR